MSTKDDFISREKAQVYLLKADEKTGWTEEELKKFSRVSIPHTSIHTPRVVVLVDPDIAEVYMAMRGSHFTSVKLGERRVEKSEPQV